MSKLYIELPRGSDPQKLWSQGKDFIQRRLAFTIIKGNSSFEQYPDREQDWFWSSQWQKMEWEADQALGKGEFRDFDEADDLFDELNREEE